MAKKNNELVVCKDGFSMSVQANDWAYCTPRMSYAGWYTEVEVGFPNEREELLMPYVEDDTDPTETVYPWTPTHVVAKVLEKHGGAVSGELPPGVPFVVVE